MKIVKTLFILSFFCCSSLHADSGVVITQETLVALQLLNNLEESLKNLTNDSKQQTKEFQALEIEYKKLTDELTQASEKSIQQRIAYENHLKKSDGKLKIYRWALVIVSGVLVAMLATDRR
jgi:uncharacterized membrane protein YhiD involved in acid resistance